MDFVEQLKSSIDIVEVIGQYVRLKKAGPRYVGLCPFHTEKTGSFSVHAAHQFYKCFGCGAGGDVLTFIQEIERVSFFEALKLLSERYGIPMPKREYSDPETKLRAALFSMHEIACRVFRNALKASSGSEARAYLVKRGISPELASEFELGYSEKSGQALTRVLEKEGFDHAQLEQSGLIMKRQDGSGFFDRFRGRLMFPIHSESGKIIGFGGRALTSDDEPKYLNSPETAIYKKTHVVYNLNRAKEAIRKTERSVLVEGYMDVIGAWRAGVHEAVASCGTSLTSEQVRTLKRHSEKIVVNFDADSAGVKAAERSIQMLLDEGMRVRVLELGGGLDPDEYVKEHGAEAYRTRLENVPGYFQWLADRARARFDMQTADGRIAGLRFLLPAIQRITDKIERAAVANDVASYLGVAPGLVLEEFRRTATNRGQKTLKTPHEDLPSIEKLLIKALLDSDEARAEVLPALKEMPAVERFATRHIIDAMAAVNAAGPAFSFAALDGRLGDKDKNLLASIAFADELGDGESALEQARACVRALAKSEDEKRKATLKIQIMEAERAGKSEEALRIYAQLTELERR